MNISLLLPFTDPDREHLRLPWSVDNYSYACNGRIMVRVPRIGDVPGRVTYAQNPEKFFDWDKNCEWRAHDRVKEPGRLRCRHCAGVGKHDCVCGNNHECGACHGIGSLESDELIMVQSLGVLLVDLAKASALRGFEIPAVIEDSWPSLPFRFDLHEIAQSQSRGFGVIHGKR